MPTSDLVRPAPSVLLIGGSAGSLEPLMGLVAALPVDLPAAVLVAVHIGENSRSHLPALLARRGALPVAATTDGEALLAGTVYVAPPGRHLLLAEDRVALSGGARVNRHRPSVDVLLASGASWFGPRAVAVVLSGVLDDGAVGAALVARAGGEVFVQADADFSSMPQAALAAAPGSRALDAGALAGACVSALRDVQTRQRPQMERPVSDDDSSIPSTSMGEASDPAFLAEGEARLVRLACPECGGGMAEVDLEQISYFTCHVGHRYSPQTLAAAQAEAVEAKLWSAVAALEEHATVLSYLDQAGNRPEGVDLAERAGAVRARARQLRHQAHAWATGPSEGAPEAS